MIDAGRAGCWPVLGQCVQLVPVRAHVDALARQCGQHGAQRGDAVGGVFFLRVQELPLVQAQAEQAHRQWLTGMVNFAVGFELEVGEVLPVVNDQEVFLDLAAGAILKQPGASANHLPELDAAEHGLGEYQVLDGGHVDAGVQHVHRDGHAGHGFELEVVQRGVGPLHVAVDDLGQSLALQLGIEPIERLVQPLGMRMAHRKDDGLVRQAANILAALVHQLTHDGVVGALVDDTTLNVAAFEVQLVKLNALVEGHLLQGLRQRFTLDALQLKVGLRVQYAVVHQVVVRHGLVIAVVVAGHASAAVEQLKGVVVDEVSGRGGQAQLNGVEMVEERAVAQVNRAVAFIGNDQVVVADRQPLVDLHHAGVGGKLDARTRGFAALNACQAFLRQMGLELGHGLANQLAPVGQKQHTLNTFGAQQQVNQANRGARLARASGHHQQELALGGVEPLGDAADGLVLIVAAGDAGVDLDTCQRAGMTALVGKALQVVTAVEPGDFAWRIGRPIPELDLFAVGQEDERVEAEFGLDGVGVVGCLALAGQLIA